MTDADSNVFYVLANETQEIGSQGGNTLSPMLQALADKREMQKSDYLLWLLNLAGDACELMAHIPLREDRQTQNLAFLKKVHAGLIVAVSASTGQHFLQAIGGSHIPDHIRLIGDSVTATNIDRADPINRPTLASRTDELLLEVQSSSLEAYPKRALELKLLAFRRLLSDCDHYTDSEIRKRAKSIYADYCADFLAHDKKSRPLSEAMTSWAKLVSRPGIFALALTSDVTTVAGYLEKL